MMTGLLVLSNVACESTSLGPSPDRYRIPRLNMNCQVPVGVTVECRAVLLDVPRWGDSQDVTSSANWTVKPPTVATFAAPGLLSPLARGEGTIHVEYGEWSGALDTTFALDPAHVARWLYWLQVTVVDAGQTAIPGAAVQILDGYQSDASCTTNAFGVCTLERLLTGETFRTRASKPGYDSVTFIYHVDPPVGVGNPPFYRIALSRLSP